MKALRAGGCMLGRLSVAIRAETEEEEEEDEEGKGRRKEC